MKKRVKMAVNNPFWDRLVLERLLAPGLIEHIVSDDSLDVLEVGCGRGGSTRLLIDRLPNSRIVATDYDPDQIALARHRLPRERVVLDVADHADLQFSDSSFDLLFEFNTLHHVPDWRRAVAEASRVLRPEGRWALAGITDSGLGQGIFCGFVAPKSVFSAEEVRQEAAAHGFAVEADSSSRKYMRYIFSKRA